MEYEEEDVCVHLLQNRVAVSISLCIDVSDSISEQGSDSDSVACQCVVCSVVLCCVV